MLLWPGCLILENQHGTNSRVVGLSWDASDKSRPLFVYHILHEIPKSDIKELIVSNKLQPLERPVLFDTVSDLIDYISEFGIDPDNLANDVRKLNEIIHFMAYMPGGGARFLVRGGLGSAETVGIKRRESQIAIRANLEQLYKAIFNAVTRIIYNKYYNDNRVEDIEYGDKVIRVDRRAHEHAVKVARSVFKDLRANQQLYFGDDWRASRRPPEADAVRQQAIAQVLVHYGDKLNEGAIAAIMQFVPKSVQSLFAAEPSFDLETAPNLFSSQLNYGKEIKNIDNDLNKLKSSLRHVSKSAELGKAIGLAFDDAHNKLQSQIDALTKKKERLTLADMLPHIRLFSKVYVNASISFKHLSDSLKQAVNDNKLIAQQQTATDAEGNQISIPVYGWNTGIDSLSLFVQNADRAWANVVDGRIPGESPGLDIDGGLMTSFISEIVRVSLKGRATIGDIVGPIVTLYIN